MKNWLITLFVPILRFFLPKGRNDENTVLVVSTTGLGDTLWAVPALRSLAKQGKRVLFLTGEYGKALLSPCPYIEKMFIASNSPFRDTLSLFKSLRKEKIGTILLFHASQRPLFPLLTLLDTNRLYAFSGCNKGLDHLLKQCIEKTGEHEIIERMRMLDAAGYTTGSPEMELFYPKEVTAETRIALFPGSKDAYKRWPASSFIELGRLLIAQEPDSSIYVVGSHGEAGLLHSIAEKIPGAIPLSEMTLPECISFIQSCTLIVTNDSGPMHLAFAAKVRTIALFSPTDPKKYGPLGIIEGVALSERTACTPCLRRKCHDNFCMRQISPRAVYEEAKQCLQHV